MNIDDGRIVSTEDLQWMREQERARFIPMALPPTSVQMFRRPYPRVGRNEPCPCGSGKKFKHCHYTRKWSDKTVWNDIVKKGDTT